MTKLPARMIEDKFIQSHEAISQQFQQGSSLSLCTHELFKPASIALKGG